MASIGNLRAMKARDILTKDETDGPATKTIMGGLGGTLSTADLIRARQKYNDYVTDFDGNGDRLAFEEWVTTMYKKGQ